MSFLCSSLSYLRHSSPVWPAMTMGCMMRVKSLSSTRWRKSTRGSKLEEDREIMLSFSSCSSLFSGIFSSLTRSGNVAPPSRAWQRVKKRSRWLSWYRRRMICCSVVLAMEAEHKKRQRNNGREGETNVTRQCACNARGRLSYCSRVDTCCVLLCCVHTKVAESTCVLCRQREKELDSKKTQTLSCCVCVCKHCSPVCAQKTQPGPRG